VENQVRRFREELRTAENAMHHIDGRSRKAFQIIATAIYDNIYWHGFDFLNVKCQRWRSQ
jgi:hypothetical protein